MTTLDSTRESRRGRRQALLLLNVVGGIAVLASYVLKLGHPSNRAGALWGGVTGSWQYLCGADRPYADQRNRPHSRARPRQLDRVCISNRSARRVHLASALPWMTRQHPRQTDRKHSHAAAVHTR